VILHDVEVSPSMTELKREEPPARKIAGANALRTIVINISHHVYFRDGVAGWSLAPHRIQCAKAGVPCRHGDAVAQDRNGRGSRVDAAISRDGSERALLRWHCGIFMQDGSTSLDSLAVANAHPMGARPFGRADYIRKFQILTEGIPAARDAIRFLDAVRDLPKLPAGALHQLHVDLPNGMLETGQKGILSLLILGGHDDE
jgi:hypothetical protein